MFRSCSSSVLPGAHRLRPSATRCAALSSTAILPPALLRLLAADCGDSRVCVPAWPREARLHHGAATPSTHLGGGQRAVSMPRWDQRLRKRGQGTTRCRLVRQQQLRCPAPSACIVVQGNTLWLVFSWASCTEQTPTHHLASQPITGARRRLRPRHSLGPRWRRCQRRAVQDDHTHAWSVDRYGRREAAGSVRASPSFHTPPTRPCAGVKTDFLLLFSHKCGDT